MIEHRKKELALTVWNLFLRDNAYQRESGFAQNALKQLQKMTYTQLDTLATLLLGKRSYNK